MRKEVTERISLWESSVWWIECSQQSAILLPGATKIGRKLVFDSRSVHGLFFSSFLPVILYFFRCCYNFRFGLFYEVSFLHLPSFVCLFVCLFVISSLLLYEPDFIHLSKLILVLLLLLFASSVFLLWVSHLRSLLEVLRHPLCWMHNSSRNIETTSF